MPASPRARFHLASILCEDLCVFTLGEARGFADVAPGRRLHAHAAFGGTHDVDQNELVPLQERLLDLSGPHDARGKNQTDL